MVTGYDEVVAAMSDRRLSRAALRDPGAVRTVSGEDFSDNPYNLLNQEGPDHSRLRRLISPPSPRARPNCGGPGSSRSPTS